MSASSNGRPEITRFTPFGELPELLTPEEFATYAAIGRTSVYELVRRGELEHMRFGRLVRIPKTAVAGK